MSNMQTVTYPTDTKAKKEHKCNFCCQPITKGSIYLKSTYVFDGIIYDWKTHKHCSEIASKLKMYDHVDEGLGEDDFHEYIRNEYSQVMSDTQNELYESKEFRIPKFPEQLEFVLQHHGINLNNEQNDKRSAATEAK